MSHLLGDLVVTYDHVTIDYSHLIMIMSHNRVLGNYVNTVKIKINC